MKVISNAGVIARRMRTRVQRWDQAMRRGLRKIVKAVDAKQVERLSGDKGAEPGSYSPVPNRRGNLMRGHFFAVKSSRLALAGNTTAYAAAVHSGNMTTRDGRRYSLRPRPFLDDAAAEVDAVGMMALEIDRGALAL